MKFCLALVLWLFSSLVYAAVDCEPSTSYNPNANGSKLQTLKNENGTVDGFWCHIVSPTTGRLVYRSQIHVILNEYRDIAYGIEATRRVLAADNFFDALNDEITSKQIKPVGPIQTYKFNQLAYLMCVKLITPPHDVPIVLPDTLAFCGAEPQPPVTQIDTFKTPAIGSLSLFTYNNGRLTGLVSGRKAPANALCNCVVAKYVNLSKTYCALQTGVATEVTECVKVP